jgi:hypothetical protein
MTTPTSTNKLLNFAEFRNFSPVYVETGTCYGGSVEKALSAGFKHVLSVEVFEKFYLHCLDKFKDNTKVALFFGKSDEMLPEMLENVRERAVFFLDAHPAGPNTGGHDDLMQKGEKSEFHQDYILTKELQTILAHGKEHLIIIDDQNGMNPENEHYMKMILEANPNYVFYFYDEQAGDIFYKDKSLVCIPV